MVLIIYEDNMKKIWIIGVLIIVVLFINACKNVDISKVSDDDLERLSEKANVCPEKYISFGTSCCLDQNANGICDRDETTEEEVPIIIDDVIEEPKVDETKQLITKEEALDIIKQSIENIPQLDFLDGGDYTVIKTKFNNNIWMIFGKIDVGVVDKIKYFKGEVDATNGKSLGTTTTSRFQEVGLSYEEVKGTQEPSLPISLLMCEGHEVVNFGGGLPHSLIATMCEGNKIFFGGETLLVEKIGETQVLIAFKKQTINIADGETKTVDTEDVLINITIYIGISEANPGSISVFVERLTNPQNWQDIYTPKKSTVI